MVIQDLGVNSPSFMDFAIPSSFARSALVYISEYGHFFCDEDYRVERQHLDAFLFVFVRSGSLHLKTQGAEYAALADQTVLLDCRYPHAYWCEEKTEFWWFHFSGRGVPEYSCFLFEKYNQSIVMIHDQPERIWTCFSRIFLYMQQPELNEHMISLQIERIFANLASFEESAAGSELFISVISYIRQHYSEEVRLEDLMNVCGFSKSYFIREFKRRLGSTPHEYLLLFRLRQSKRLLTTTSKSVEVIAEECGFNSASHFARAFKKEMNITPTEFRTIKY